MAHGNTKPQPQPPGAKCAICGLEGGDLIQSVPGVYQCDGSCALQARKVAEREQPEPMHIYVAAPYNDYWQVREGKSGSTAYIRVVARRHRRGEAEQVAEMIMTGTTQAQRDELAGIAAEGNPKGL
jgi:hypothetical protein